MLVRPFRAAPAALLSAATHVAPRAAVAAFPRTTFPVRAFARQSDNDNQFNRNKDKFKNSRGVDNPADEEYHDNANHPIQDDNLDFDYDEYWHTTRRTATRSEPSRRSGRR